MELQATPLFEPELLLQAQGLRACVFDVDGVWTDGSLHFGADGEVLKTFHTLDGYGIKLLHLAGYRSFVITGRDSPALRRRLVDLGVHDARFGVDDKRVVAEELLNQHALEWHHCAVIGDDWPDLPLLLRAGFSCAPSNAHAQVKASVHHVLHAAGGQGAVRELCDLLITANGRYGALLHQEVGL